MAQIDRSLGWVALAAESVAYGTLGASLVYQQGISVSPTFNEVRTIPPVLGSVSASTGVRLASNFSGNVTLAHTDEGDDVGVLYGHFGSLSTATYTFGGTPVNDSLSLFYDLNGIEYDVAGCYSSSITWTLANQDFSAVSFDLIGRAPVKYAGAPRTPSLPPATELVKPVDLTTFTVGGAAIAGISAATITYSRQITGMERQRLGTAVLAQPCVYGRPTITASFTLELDDATGNDTIELIDDLLADTAGANIILDNFAIGGCKVVGDMPELARGLGTINLRVQAASLSVITS
jgi:hypothetical protein